MSNNKTIFLGGDRLVLEKPLIRIEEGFVSNVIQMSHLFWNRLYKCAFWLKYPFQSIFAENYPVKDSFVFHSLFTSIPVTVKSS